MVRRFPSPGAAAWAVLVVYVTIYDVLAMRKGFATMSKWFAVRLESRIGRPALVTIWFVLTTHLFGILPKKYDPLRSWR